MESNGLGVRKCSTPEVASRPASGSAPRAFVMALLARGTSVGDGVVVQGALQGPVDLAEALGVVRVQQQDLGTADAGPDLAAAAALVVRAVDELQQDVGQGR